jgi:hypothetical protein
MSRTRRNGARHAPKSGKKWRWRYRDRGNCGVVVDDDSIKS